MNSTVRRPFAGTALRLFAAYNHVAAYNDAAWNAAKKAKGSNAGPQALASGGVVGYDFEG